MLWQGRQSNGEKVNNPTTDASCGGRPALMRALAPSVPWQPAQLASSPLSKASPVPCTEVSLNCASLEKIRVVSLWHSVQDRSAAAGPAPPAQAVSTSAAPTRAKPGMISLLLIEPFSSDGLDWTLSRKDQFSSLA